MADKRILIDTNVLVWMATDSAGLSTRAAAELRDASNLFFVGPISLNELAIKVTLGKLRLDLSARESVDIVIEELQASQLSLTLEHADQIEHLPLHHRDPFDRLLIAQAMVEGLAILSSDAAFDRYDVERIW